MLNFLRNVIRGFSSILCLNPRTSNLKSSYKRLYKPKKDPLKSDWENVGRDMWNAISKIDEEIKK